MKTKPFNFRLLILIALPLLMFSCKDDNLVTPAEPEEPEVMKLKLKSQEVIEFQSIINSDQPTKIAEDKIEGIFGSRIKYFIPIEIIISADSTTLIKEGSITEKYKSKWENAEELYIKDENKESWKLLGTKSGDSFILKTAFFFKQVQGLERNSALLGQAYELENYSSLISPDEQFNLTWLRIDATYKNN
ncbi:hypothetical protein PZ892_10605 [Sphingobacterium sp. WM]|uniref:hypothetical protein n=1 Tax=Sphingobacterium sp. WM TaxID=3031802 RepID=UPI00240E0D50|nr:hypothetical protein [Sphingobacterium sp. WM]WFB62131.1 hypothetical protein PZ892_10605 [Sphingobacterium sp. WM]